MKTILNDYYHMDVDIKERGYFQYQHSYYYIDLFYDIGNFLSVYQTYQLYMSYMRIKGYELINNNRKEFHTFRHVVFKYHPSVLYLDQYIDVFMTVLPMKVNVKSIKEQWIEKIDDVKECAKEYAYSFKQNIDILSLIYYYSALGENAILLLNGILSFDENISLSMCLSLKQNILPYTYEILNPIYYMYSTRMRHIVYLLKSHIIDVDDLGYMIEKYHFEQYELLYLYARMLYPSDFYDDLLHKRIDIYNLENYFYDMRTQMHLLYTLSRLLTNYITIPKISWINEENMI